MEPLLTVRPFLTFCDIIADGACASGVIAACKRKGVWFGNTEDLLPVFDHDEYLVRAAKLNGNGDGDGGFR